MNDVLNKISALMAKAADPAATEFEANEAMKLAQKLMSKNMIDAAKLAQFQANKDDKFVEKTIDLKRKNRPEALVFGLSATIAKFTSCKTYTTKDRFTKNLNLKVFGEAADIEIYEYMLTICMNALETEFSKFMSRNSTGVHGRTLRTGFMSGMIARLCERLEKMKDDMAADVVAQTGTALVIVKDQLVTEAFAKRVTNLKKPAKTKRELHAASYFAGVRQGDKVALNKAIQ